TASAPWAWASAAMAPASRRRAVENPTAARASAEHRLSIDPPSGWGTRPPRIPPRSGPAPTGRPLSTTATPTPVPTVMTTTRGQRLIGVTAGRRLAGQHPTGVHPDDAGLHPRSADVERQEPPLGHRHRPLRSTS